MTSPRAHKLPRPLPRRRPRAKLLRSRWLPWLALSLPLAIAGTAALVLMSAFLILFSSQRILPGVGVAGIAVGGLSQSDAAAKIQQVWEGRGIELHANGQIYPAQASALGITLDSQVSAASALSYGHNIAQIDDALRAILRGVDLSPAVSWDREAFSTGLSQMAQTIERPPINAGVQWVDGQLTAREAAAGFQVDVSATVAALEAEGSSALADGTITLITQPVLPTWSDPAPIIAAASALLTRPLEIRAYNPVTNQTLDWSLQPQEWGAWLTAQPDPAQPSGLTITLDRHQLETYLTQREQELPAEAYLNFDESLSALTQAAADQSLRASLRVYNHDRQHTVQAGESITSIAWDYGVPYLYIQQANPGLTAVSIGQTITVPSADVFLEYPLVPDKRIVVSISEQRVRVYENGSLKWDWVASTGISSSPTWTGIYQILSHEQNAYAGNWDLWMPNFMGVYRPIPDADFTNGFHGFPTRGGSQLLWTNSLGSRVTYGCILLSNENIQQLYEWAETGVVVEITA